MLKVIISMILVICYLTTRNGVESRYMENMKNSINARSYNNGEEEAGHEEQRRWAAETIGASKSVLDVFNNNAERERELLNLVGREKNGCVWTGCKAHQHGSHCPGNSGTGEWNYCWGIFGKDEKCCPN